MTEISAAPHSSTSIAPSAAPAVLSTRVTRTRVLVTRPLAQSEDLCARLRAAGFDPVAIPTIAIQPLRDLSALDAALVRLRTFTYLIVPSANAARILAARLSVLAFTPAGCSHLNVIAGVTTAAVLASYGLIAGTVLSPFSAEAVLDALATHPVAGRHVLLPRALEGRETTGTVLRDRGAIVEEIPVYRTVPIDESPELARELRAASPLVVTFFSPSSVRGFDAALRAAVITPDLIQRPPFVACLGATTAAEAHRLGWRVDAVAGDTTAAAFVESLAAHVRPAVSAVLPIAAVSVRARP